ncbi:MAG: hypothetical protein ACREOP_02130 [Thermodesulfobacteriota bacterium]
MKILIALSSLVIPVVFAVYGPISAIGAEGISTVSAESETVSAAPGKSVSVRSACPAGRVLTGGGGECYGYLVTDGRVSLAKSAPVGSAWAVECVNTGTRPGDIQAKALAICADQEAFEMKKKK